MVVKVNNCLLRLLSRDWNWKCNSKYGYLGEFIQGCKKSLEERSVSSMILDHHVWVS